MLITNTLPSYILFSLHADKMPSVLPAQQTRIVSGGVWHFLRHAGVEGSAPSASWQRVYAPAVYAN